MFETVKAAQTNKNQIDYTLQVPSIGVLTVQSAQGWSSDITRLHKFFSGHETIYSNYTYFLQDSSPSVRSLSSDSNIRKKSISDTAHNIAVPAKTTPRNDDDRSDCISAYVSELKLLSQSSLDTTNWESLDMNLTKKTRVLCIG